MGTRSMTHVIDSTQYGLGNCILSMYRQYDGYIDGHGQELAKVLADAEIVNGISGGQKQFNGAGDLAVRLVTALKNESGGPDAAGNFYIEAPDPAHTEEYTYTVTVSDAGIHVHCQAYGRVVFDGTPEALVSFQEPPTS